MRTSITWHSLINDGSPTYHAWIHWVTVNNDRHVENFRAWLKENYNIDLIRPDKPTAIFRLEGDEKDCMMFILRWS